MERKSAEAEAAKAEDKAAEDSKANRLLRSPKASNQQNAPENLPRQWFPFSEPLSS
ncbi:MAG: hypothetical protein ACLUKN_12415 [Bacilli bacterium]